MRKNLLVKILIFSSVYLSGASICCFSQTSCSAFAPPVFSSGKTINTTNQTGNELNINLSNGTDNSKMIDLNENADSSNFENATDKFVQCNIRASWENFKTLINNSQNNDFMYISFANKMADLGLFDLADLASSKIKDKDISGISTDAMKRFYYPRRKLKQDDELFLAEAYSNILYNDQSSEAINELLKNQNLLSNSDYANYLVAFGYYNSNDFRQAGKYINIAVLQNPSNLNYQKLKAQIFAQQGESVEALKVVDSLKKQNLYSYEYERKIDSLEQFILYKIKKDPWEKDYHLGYYYYLENDSSKAIKTLQDALSVRSKCNKGLIYGLMSKVYYSMAEFEKAADTAKKSYKIDKNNPNALVTLGDLSYRDANYKKALIYYHKAACADKKSYKPMVEEAQTYQKLANIKKSKEIYTKILKTYSDSWEAYYNVALLEKDKQTIYLKKALAVNPLFGDAWIELAKINIENGNYEIAQNYLLNAFYIDENNFKYYYYQGLINNNTGNFAQAKYNFKKCLKLKSDFKEAQNSLDSILNSENGNSQGQGNI